MRIKFIFKYNRKYTAMRTKNIFLLSNDDGYISLGIKNLRNYLLNYGNVILVAPRINKSACSSSLTVNKKIKITKIVTESILSMERLRIASILQHGFVIYTTRLCY